MFCNIQLASNKLAAKDHELRQAVKGFEDQLLQATQSLAEYKHRALTAEVGQLRHAAVEGSDSRIQLQLEESHTNITRTQELEKEVKDKKILIDKLRHEGESPSLMLGRHPATDRTPAVIINEHLMEALRRLRRNSTETNVDRRLVTNVLLSFLTTPRADSKRFEMLSLLASILSWSEQEREKAGLQRTGILEVSTPSSFWGRSSSVSSPAKTEPEKSDETEVGVIK